MPNDQLFPDWQSDDLITSAKLNQMKNNVIPWSQAGVAGGVATLDSNGRLHHPGAVIAVGSITAGASLSTTANVSAGVGGVMTDLYLDVDVSSAANPILIVSLHAIVLSDADDYPGIRIVQSADGGASWSVFSPHTYTRTLAGGDNRKQLSITYAATISPSVRRIAGAFGNTGSGNTVRCYGSRWLHVMAVENP